MIFAIIILVIVFFATISYLAYRHKKPTSGNDSINSSFQNQDEFIDGDFHNHIGSNKNFRNPSFYSGTDNIKQHNDKLHDTDKLVKRVTTIPIKTYINGKLIGKFLGTKNEEYAKHFLHSKFFDFEIYEAAVDIDYNLGIRKHPLGQFDLNQNELFKFSKLPQKLLCRIFKDNSIDIIEVSILDAYLYDINISHELHQSDGKDVYGTITANVTGYILHYEEKVEYVARGQEINIPGSFIGDQSDINQTKKGESKSGKSITNSVESIKNNIFLFLPNLIAWLAIICFLIVASPVLLYILPFYLIPYLLYLFSGSLKKLFSLIGFIILILFIYSIISHLRNPYFPIIKSNDDKKESRTTVKKDPLTNDTIITHFRSWNDYDGKLYEGTVWVKKSSFDDAQIHKKNLMINGSNVEEYNRVIFELKDFDKYKLQGVYTLLDSLQLSNKLNRTEFAKVILSFVQDIPYTLILPAGCNGRLYDDQFIKKYLSSENSRCQGYQRYGINSPVEFIATLNGDCDTRTLLLYTMYVKYNYDVILLSSEFYGHSIIGINLPINGYSISNSGINYVLCETTAPNIPPGIIPKEISNLNYWKISLNSKSNDAN